MKKSNLLKIGALILVLCGYAGSATVSPVFADGSCSGITFQETGTTTTTDHPKVNKSYDVIVNNARDQGGTGISSTSGSAVLRTVRVSSGDADTHTPFAMTYVNAFPTPYWTATGVTINVPVADAGTEDAKVIMVYTPSGGSAQTICSRQVYTEPNDALIRPSLTDFANPGCSNDIDCSTKYGDISRCGDTHCRQHATEDGVDPATCGSGANGDYQYGKVCVHGASIALGGSCDVPQNGYQGRTNACQGSSNGSVQCMGNVATVPNGPATNPTCQRSCEFAGNTAAQVACLKTRYGSNIISSIAPIAGCTINESSVVLAREGRFVSGVGSCDDECSKLYSREELGRSGNSEVSTSLLLCFGNTTSCADADSTRRCTITPSITAGVLNVDIQSQCSLTGNYTLRGWAVTSRAINPDGSTPFVTKTVNWTAGTTSQTVNVTGLNGRPGEGITFQLEDPNNSTNVYCQFSQDVFFPTAGPGVTPIGPPPESTEFGIRNCPYQTPTDQAQRDEHNNCVTCVTAGNTWTAIGCVNTSVAGVFTTLVRIALGVMGGVVLLRMIYLGYLYQTGDTKKIEEAKAGVMSTIAGIIVVVFSVVILRVVGVNLLDIVPAGFFGS